MACPGGTAYGCPISAAEIIEELPRLTEAERRAVRTRLIELASGNPDVDVCDLAAIEGAQMLDQMEAEDARRRAG